MTGLQPNQNYPGFRVFYGLAPMEGPVAVPIDLDFTLQSSYTIDLVGELETSVVPWVEAIYIDNSLNPFPLSVTFSISNQTVTCPAYSQGYFPCLCPNKPRMAFNLGGVTTNTSTWVQLLSMPVPAAVWSASNSSASNIIANAQTVAVQPSLTAGANPLYETLQGALFVEQADAVNFNNSVLTNGTVTNGLFSSGVVTNPATNQVLLGPIDTTGAESFSFQLSITSGAGVAINFQESESPSGPWAAISGQSSANTVNFTALFSTNGATFSAPIRARYMQAVAVTGGAQTFTITGYLRASPFYGTLSSPDINYTAQTSLGSALANGVTAVPAVSSSRYTIDLPYSAPELTWQYSTAGAPITSATTTQIQAAGAASVRNYLAGLTITNTGAAGTEVQILDGATVIWDGYVGASTTAASVVNVVFNVPIRGSAATAMSIKTVSGATISLYVSAQGYQAF
jgi:hypothetical protein